jgi:transglutaminase/protease-like cytokinesis protein 3
MFRNKKKWFVYVCVLLLCCLPLIRSNGQNVENDYSSIDLYARNVPVEYENDPKKLTQYLIKPALNEWQKIRSIFIWVTNSISYDDSSYNAESFTVEKSQAMYVFQKRKAVCEGYANLFSMLCGFAGIDCYTIRGYGKDMKYKRGKSMKEYNHAWNVIEIDGGLHHFDVAWASGHDRNGVTVNEYNNFWWDTPSTIFITTHFTEDVYYNNMDHVVTKKEFEKMVPLTSEKPKHK